MIRFHQPRKDDIEHYINCREDDGCRDVGWVCKKSSFVVGIEESTFECVVIMKRSLKLERER